MHATLLEAVIAFSLLALSVTVCWFMEGWRRYTFAKEINHMVRTAVKDALDAEKDS